MKCVYDFHIHTCLSPCGDDDMTPNNIVNMAKLVGLDAIAVTDHNTAGNVRAVCAAGQKLGLTVLPGMELETSEEVHIVLLFPDCGAAEACGAYVSDKRFRIANKVEIYGHQYLADASDEIVGEESDLLLTATSIGVYDAQRVAERYGGIAVPAHIDKPANGILAILGAIDDDMGFGTVEVSPRCGEALKREMTERGYRVIVDSDSHYLDTLAAGGRNVLYPPSKKAADIIRFLKGKSQIKGA